MEFDFTTNIQELIRLYEKYNKVNDKIINSYKKISKFLIFIIGGMLFLNIIKSIKGGDTNES